jgi:hypothetical protein
MPVKFDVVAATGTYTAKDGSEKKSWMKIGSVIQTQKGMSLKLNAVPVGWDGWAMLAEPKDKPQKADYDDGDSSVPF